jgi:hypothetical protein
MIAESGLMGKNLVVLFNISWVILVSEIGVDEAGLEV